MTERRFTVQRRMHASADAIWAVFADFPNLAEVWSGLRDSQAIGEQTSGVGARRLVKLKPIGSLTETVTTWDDGRTMATRNQPSASVPMKEAEATLSIEPNGDGALVSFDYRYVPSGGPVGKVTGPLIDRMLTAEFEDMLAAAEQAVQGDVS